MTAGKVRQDALAQPFVLGVEVAEVPASVQQDRAVGMCASQVLRPVPALIGHVADAHVEAAQEGTLSGPDGRIAGVDVVRVVDERHLPRTGERRSDFGAHPHGERVQRVSR